jgi:iron complex outermembrane receptor protein
MKIWNTFFLWIIAFTASARPLGDISGIIKDSNNGPLEFTNVVLLNSSDSTLVKAAMTDGSGKFILNDISQGSYLLMAYMVGFEKYYAPLDFNGSTISLDDIVMKAGGANLKEVNIEAMHPLIEHQVDRTVVNVENTIINSGGNAIEVLKRSPGVTVDNNGNISLRGKQAVLVMIDGKPTYLSNSDLYTMLKNMSSEELSKIEIITNPSAKYDAAGNAGIINLKLRKKQNLGFNGSINGSYGQGVYPDYGIGTNLNYRNEKFNAFGSYHYGQNFSYEETTLNRRFKEAGYTSTFDQEANDKTKFDNQNIRTGLDLFLSKKHTAGFLVKANFNNDDDKTSSTTLIKNLTENPDSGYTTINKSTGKWNNFAINLNHQFAMDTAGRELTTDIDFASYHNRNDFNFETNYFSDLPGYIPYTELEKSSQPAVITIRSFKMDYTQTMFKTYKLEAGIKSSFVVTDNDVQYYIIVDGTDVPDSSRSNHFKYKENINAAYVNVHKEFGKWGTQIGLRAEQTVAKGEQLTTADNSDHNYVQLFPSVFITFKMNEKNQFGLNYSRRIDRPAYQQLNPFRYFIDPKTYEQGNPDLQPQLTNSFELSYTLMDALNIAVNYSHTDNVMTNITKQVDSTRTTYVTTENLSAQDNYGITVTLPLPVTKWWLTSNTLNVFNNNFTGMVEGGEVNERLTTYSFNTYNSFKIKDFISLELSAYYNSPSVYGTFLIDPQYSVSAGLAKAFLKERLSLRVSINDIFKTEGSEIHVNYNNVDFDYKRSEDSRFVRFFVTYKFGKRGVEQARRRRVGAEDEQSRVKTSK